MAGELKYFGATGLTVYAILLDYSGAIWNGSAFEAINASNWTDYDIALTEATAGIYIGDMPGGAGVYSYAVYSQAGASPATTDTLKGTGRIEWNGLSEIIPAEAGGEMALIDDAITAGKFDESTAFPIPYAPDQQNDGKFNVNTILFDGSSITATMLSMGGYTDGTNTFQFTAGQIPADATGTSFAVAAFEGSYFNDAFNGQILYTQYAWAARIVDYDYTTFTITLDKTIPVDVQGQYFLIMPEQGASGGGGLTAQETRDAMKLAPSVGAADADSIDDKLTDLQTGVNVSEISGDATAADNLELQFDGTGVVGDQYPATQAQVSNIVITGSPAYVGASSYTLTTGTQTGGTYASTDTSNGVYHVHTDTGGVLSFYYEYLLAADEVATGIVFKGRINSGNDSALIQAYDWVGAAWVTLFTLAGTAGTTDTNQSPALVSKYTGTGANVGKVRIRVLNAVALTTATCYVDQLIVGKTITNRSVGYQDGAVWIDATNGTAGSAAFVNGTVDNPCTTIAEAYSIAAAVGLTALNIAPGTTVTLTQAADKWRIEGNGRVILGSQSIADATFKDLYTISGLSTGDDAVFENCGIGDATIYHAYFERCRLKGTLTFTASQNYFFDRCFDANESASVQTFVFAANAAAMFRDWRGGIQLNSMAATNEAIIDGAGRVVIDASSVGGAITIRGHFPAATGAAAFVTAGGSITDNARWAEDQDVANVTGTVAALATDAITAASLKTDAVTEIQTGVLVAGFGDGTRATYYKQFTMPGSETGLTTVTPGGTGWARYAHSILMANALGSYTIVSATDTTLTLDRALLLGGGSCVIIPAQEALKYVIETLTAEEILRVLLAQAAGKSSGGGTATVVFRDQADTKDRLELTVDSNGNRSATALDAT